MQVILEAIRLWEMIEPKLTTKADTKKDKTSIAYIYQSLPEEQLLLISKYKTAKDVWDALKKRHIEENRILQAKQQTLKSEFEMLQMEENESIDSFVTSENLDGGVTKSMNRLGIKEAIYTARTPIGRQSVSGITNKKAMFNLILNLTSSQGVQDLFNWDPQIIDDYGCTYLKQIKETFKEQKEKYDEFRDAMKDFKAHRVDIPSTIARVRRLFEGFLDLILGFNTLLTKEHEITIDEPQANKPMVFDEAFQFVNKIKTRFEGDKRSYSSFLSIFSMYKNNIKFVSEVHPEVAALLHNQPDLLKEFANFLPSRHVLEDSDPSLKKIEDSVAELFHQAMRDKVLYLREKVKKRLNYQKLLGCVVHYDTGNITRSNLENLVNDILGAYPDLMEEVNGFIDCSDSAGSLWSGNLPESVKADNEDQDRERDVKTVSVIKDEYQAKPIHELDLSDCEQCGPSYWHLPKDVLNDHWVSVNSGSDDYSFKHMRKNQYEESLFRCEDDRYELDMLIRSAKAAAKSVEDLLKKIDNKLFKIDSDIIFEDHLSGLNLRCIV
nr:SIN3-like 5 [Tanacetum cinerariifolium]